MYPFLCRLLGHKLRDSYVYGAESIGLAQNACIRRHCTYVAVQYTVTDLKIVGH
ncbi:hypothetical protein SEA_JENOS_5 [Microbacterium phage Jenos]|nr:hypothetical protein SEA_JENOS_5 [Microbacterium phage Jenos]